MIFQLFYKSKTKEEVTEQDLDDIVLTAIEKNSTINVTGCLVYFNNELYQILEGEQQTVKSLYEDIKNDKKYFNVTLLNQELTEYRLFSNWNMAFCPIDEIRNGENMVNEFKHKIQLLNSLNFSKDSVTDFWCDVRKTISKGGIIDFVI